VPLPQLTSSRSSLVFLVPWGFQIQRNPLSCILILPNSMPYPLPFSFFF
jgi:hypothetical protein